MAAIDKLYLNDWYEFDRLVRWSICYYPKLLNYMYDWRMTYKDWDKAMKESIKSTKQIFKRELEKIGGKNVSLRDGIYNLIDHYRKDADYECSYEQAKEEVEYILKRPMSLMMNWRQIISDLLCLLLVKLIENFFGLVHCQKSASIYMNSVDIRNVGNGYISYFGKVNMN